VGRDYLCTQHNVSPETLKAVRHHHEYLDGSGYPDGLMAQQIGDLTRILTICDVYGALTERRAYKAPKPPEAALDILTGMAKDAKVEHDLVKALRYCVAA
jgi:HD-GYP domain-containing protein (c-di-GMP phosphodiesterase class II)